MIKKLLAPAGSSLMTTLSRKGNELSKNFLSIGGIVAGCVAAFQVAGPLGWAAVMVGCFVLEYLMDDGASTR